MASPSRSWLTASRTSVSSSLASVWACWTCSCARPSVVAGDFQVQAERGQVVAEQVVQFARDAGALVDAGAFGQQRAGGAQFGIEPALLVARLRLLPRDQAVTKTKPENPT